MPPAVPATTRWYREPMAWLVFGIPALAVVSGVAMLVISSVGYDGVVVDDYYRQGLTVDRDLARDARAAELGVSAVVSLPAGGNTAVDIEPGRWPVDEQLALRLVHSTRAGLDRTLTLARRSERRFVGPGVALAPGRWHVELAADDWRLRGRITAPDSERLALTPAR